MFIACASTTCTYQAACAAWSVQLVFAALKTQTTQLSTPKSSIFKLVSAAVPADWGLTWSQNLHADFPNYAALSLNIGPDERIIGVTL